VTFFRGILEAVDRGEHIQSLLLKAFVEKKTTLLIPKKAEKLFQCHACKEKELAGSAGKIIKLSVTSRFSKIGIQCRLFFCKDCLKQNGTPIRDYEGFVVWKEKRFKKATSIISKETIA
jgi:hypothetical protein